MKNQLYVALLFLVVIALDTAVYVVYDIVFGTRLNVLAFLAICILIAFIVAMHANRRYERRKSQQ